MTEDPQQPPHTGTEPAARPGTAVADVGLWHLLERLALVEERVRRLVGQRQAVDPDPDDAFRGLYLSDEAVRRLLDDRPGVGDLPPPAPDPERQAAAEAAADTAEQSGSPTRLRSLVREFGLVGPDVEVLLIALAPDLDARFESFYGYLNDDVTRRRPTVGLALELCGLSAANARVRARLDPQAALRSGGLLLVEDGERPFLGRSLRVPDRVAGHLLGDDTPDPRLVGLDGGWRAEPDAGDVVSLTRALGVGTGPVYLREEPGGAAASLALAALAGAGRPGRSLDLVRLVRDPAPLDAARAAVREARLTGAALVCGPVDPGGEQPAEGDPPGGGLAEVLRELTSAPVPLVLFGRGPWDAAWSQRSPLLWSAPRLDTRVRARLWTRAYTRALAGMAPSRPVALPGVDVERLLSPFLLTPGQIDAAAHSAARSAALVRAGDGHGGGLGAEQVRRGARAQNAAGLDRLARRVEPSVGWEDLVLPPDALAQLRELAARARHRDLVLGQWRMRPGGGRGHGVAALFAGDSGTGKTMSAEVVAGDLGLDLYTVDLASVVDKYVGETEKNLERIFAEAAGVNGVLLFDEADAVFGKRSEVKDAHDRYANVESAYLLQRMESFDGLAVLATNLRANLDDAFTRRLDLVVDFPLPDPEQRLALWQRCLPERLPRAADVDLEFCAHSFELSGGSIRSIAVTAAYLTAEAGGAVTMATLIRATRREYQKLGRLTLPSEFGPYLELLTVQEPPGG